MKRFSSLALVLMVISILSCSSSEKKAEKKISMKPTSADALQPLMAKHQANLRYLVYGLINFDATKIEKSTSNMVSICQYTSKLTNYQHKGSAEEWAATCEELAQRVEDIKQHTLSDDYNEAALTFGKLLAVCVKCHKAYRFGR